ncbi:MAG: hypothetical protein BEN19_08355 [Epulopiscium sp. Nuni2H_MBin003]|nr:MAG: hypothetical protein BEN19_08355 [Epulopiscium sp. Nuni2H_MBin003]
MNNALNILYYSKISGDLTELVDIKELMALQIINDKSIQDRVNKEEDVAFLQKMVTKSILKGRTKVNFNRTAETSSQILAHNNFCTAKFIDTPLSININFQQHNTANYYFKGYRTTKISIPNISITPATLFEIKKLTNMYPTEKFSLGFTFLKNLQTVGYSLSVVPATTGQKGQASCILSVLTQDNYIIDDASKYFDVTNLIKNMSV